MKRKLTPLQKAILELGDVEPDPPAPEAASVDAAILDQIAEGVGDSYFKPEHIKDWVVIKRALLERPRGAVMQTYLDDAANLFQFLEESLNALVSQCITGQQLALAKTGKPGLDLLRQALLNNDEFRSAMLLLFYVYSNTVRLSHDNVYRRPLLAALNRLFLHWDSVERRCIKDVVFFHWPQLEKLSESKRLSFVHDRTAAVVTPLTSGNQPARSKLIYRLIQQAKRS